MIASVIRLIRAFSSKLRDDSVSAFAAQAAFFIILSIFPFLMFLLTLLNYLPIPLDKLQSHASDFFPGMVGSVLSGIAAEISERASGTIISVTALAALWSASRGALALSRGLNAVYRHRETRNYFLLRAVSALYTLVFAVLLILTLLLLVFGNQVYHVVLEHMPFLGDFAFLLLSIRSLLTLCLLTLFFLLIYMAVPNRKSKLLSELPGAILAAGGWLLFSFLFSFYIDNMSSFSHTYGSLTAIAVCMLWLYSCLYILFIGAEINMVLAHPKVLHATKRFLNDRKQTGTRSTPPQANTHKN